MIDAGTFEEIGELIGFSFAALLRGFKAGLKEHELNAACREVEEQAKDEPEPPTQGKTSIVDCLECVCDICACFDTCGYAEERCPNCQDGNHVFSCPDFKQGNGRNHS
jgi:hypothetical protein